MSPFNSGYLIPSIAFGSIVLETKVQPRQMKKVQERLAENARHQKSVLLVEDEPAAREATKLYLIRCGFRVESASDGESAIAKAAHRQPDVLVCDWRLGPGPDGGEVARELYERYRIPVIFVSAYPMDELCDTTQDIEVLRCFQKPVSLTALAEAVAAG